MTTSQELSKEDLEKLPYDFVEAKYWTKESDHTFWWSAQWHNREVYTTELGVDPWFFEETKQEVTRDDWERYYPGFKKVTITDTAQLIGTYKGSKVCWSRTAEG
jgi:hypothetical protein